MYKKQPYTQSQSLEKGFSLLELIVAISIFIVLSSAFLINYNSFNKRISIDTLAHQIGQWVRDAQVSAMSVKRTSVSSTVFPGYGLHFSTLTPNKFIFFADSLTANNQYDAGVGICGSATTECEREVQLLQGNVLEALCGDAPSGAAITAKCGLLDTSETFDIVFTRPNPDAVITGDLGGASFPTAYSRAQIHLLSPAGHRRVVEVWTTGQVSIR